METPAQTLKRLVNRKPVKCNVLDGENQYLHPIGLIDQMVLDGQLREIFQVASERVENPETREQVITQGLTIGTVQLALRNGDAPESERVFPSFQEAFDALRYEPDKCGEMFELYYTTFNISSEEKKI